MTPTMRQARRTIRLAEFHQVLSDEAEADGDEVGARIESRAAARIYCEGAYLLVQEYSSHLTVNSPEADRMRSTVRIYLERARSAYERAGSYTGRSRYYRKCLNAIDHEREKRIRECVLAYEKKAQRAA